MTSFAAKALVLAVDEDIDALRKSQAEILNATREAVKLFSVTSNKFIAALGIQNQRIGNIMKMLLAHRTAYMQLFTEVRNLFFTAEGTNKVMEKLFAVQNEIMYSMFEMEEYREAIYAAVSGKLTPVLVPPESLTQAVNELQAHLNKKGSSLTVIHKSARYYYARASFTMLRVARSLIISVTCPLGVSENPFYMYTVTYIPFHLHGSIGVHSILQEDTVAVAILPNTETYLRLTDVRDIPTTPDWDISLSNIFLRINDTQNCIWSIIANDKMSIRKHCTYHILPEVMTPTVTRLDANAILLSNITVLELRCYNESDNQTVHSVGIVDKQLIKLLTCECDLLIKQTGQFIPRVFQDCEGNSTQLKFVHILNLAQLQQFFTDAQLQFIDPDTWINNNVTVTLPAILLASSEDDRGAAVEKTLRYNFNKLLNSSKADQRIFDRFSDYLWNQLSELVVTRSSFNLFDWSHWFAVGSGVLAVLSLMGNIYLIFKFKALAIIVGAIRATSATSIESNLTVPTALIYAKKVLEPSMVNTNQTILDFIQILNTEQAQSMTMNRILILLLILIALTSVLIANRHKSTRKFHVCLEIANATRSVHIRMLHLLGPQSCFVVTGTNATPTVRLLMRYIELIWPSLRIKHKLLGTIHALPARKRLATTEVNSSQTILYPVSSRKRREIHGVTSDNAGDDGF